MANDCYEDDTGDLFMMKLKCHGSCYNLIGKCGQIIRGEGVASGTGD